jgi:hypothetical protein
MKVVLFFIILFYSISLEMIVKAYQLFFNFSSILLGQISQLATVFKKITYNTL